MLGYRSLLWLTCCFGMQTLLRHHPTAEYATVCGCSVTAGRVTWDRYHPGVELRGMGRCSTQAWHRLLVGVGLLGAGCSSGSSGSARVLVWTRLGAWEGAVPLCSALGMGLRGHWVWVGAAWMLPCRGPMPGGDVICGGARARVESRDSRLGAGQGPAELDGVPSLFTPGWRRARLKSRDLPLGAGSEPAGPALHPDLKVLYSSNLQPFRLRSMEPLLG